MNIYVIGSDIKVERMEIDGEWGDSVSLVPKIMGFNAISMAYDPYFLFDLENVPTILEITNKNMHMLDNADIVIVPYYVNEEIEIKLIELIKEGKPVFWSKPPQNILNEIPGLKEVIRYNNTLLSNREDWLVYGKTFSYPQALWFDSYELTGDIDMEGCIGELPDMLKYKNLFFSTVDYFSAYVWYRSCPEHMLEKEGFTNYFSIDYVKKLKTLLGKSLEQHLEPMFDNFDIRREFHSYGYARKMIFDLSEALEQEISFEECDNFIKQAAIALVEDNDSEKCNKYLKNAFCSLYEVRKQIVPIPIYILEAQHGGIMYENFGFAEYDSPDYMLKLIEVYLELNERKNYRFSIEVGVSTHENMAKRFPKFTRKLADFWKEGKIDMLNGTYAQPYPYYFSLESTIRQFQNGQKMMEKLFGQRVKYFSSQEYSLTPSFPGILKDFGYDGACHRMQHTGTTTMEKDEMITWQGCDGEQIKAMPSHFDRSEKYCFRFFADWVERVVDTVRNKYKSGIYTNMLDLMWVTPFREETIRACNYAPVLGEFVTFKDLFEKDFSYPVKEYTRDNYENLPFQNHFYTGTFSSSIRICEKASKYLEGLEKLTAVTGRTNSQIEKAITDSWKSLNEYQNHDAFCVPLATVGGHTRHIPGKSTVNRFLTVQLQGRKDLAKNLKACSNSLEGIYKNTIPDNIYVFNPNGFEKFEYIITDNKGCLKNLNCLDNLSQVKTLQKVTLLPMGIKCISIKEADNNVPKIQEDTENFISNGLVKITVNQKSGEISSIINLLHHKEIINKYGNSMKYGIGGYMDCSSIRRLRCESIQQLEVCGGIYDESGMLRSLYRTYISLAEGNKRVYFNTILSPLVSADQVDVEKSYGKEWVKNQWENSVSVSFDLQKCNAKFKDCWMNLISDEKRSQFQSLNFLFVEDIEAGSNVCLHNTGNQHYEVKDSNVTNILWHEKEERLDYQYALDILEDNSVMECSLDYQYDFLTFKENIQELNSSSETPWVSLDTSKIYISAIHREENTIHIRLVNSEGIENETRLKFGFKVTKAYKEDAYGNCLENLTIGSGSEIYVNLKKWSICNIAVIV